MRIGLETVCQTHEPFQSAFPMHRRYQALAQKKVSEQTTIKLVRKFDEDLIRKENEDATFSALSILNSQEL